VVVVHISIFRQYSERSIRVFQETGSRTWMSVGEHCVRAKLGFQYNPGNSAFPKQCVSFKISRFTLYSTYALQIEGTQTVSCCLFVTRN